MEKLTFKQIRKMFWELHPQFKSEYKKTYAQNDYRTDIRVSFTDFIYFLFQDGKITENQYNKITL